MMNRTKNIVASTTSVSKLTRARFSPGMLLQHEDLEQLNTYTRDLSRLLFRSLFGCGVICGLVVQAKVDTCNKVVVTVGAGVALDCSGDPIYVPTAQRLVIDELCYPDLPDRLWVVVCGTTKACAPRTSICTDDDTTNTVCSRERSMFEIRVLRERPQCACGCAEPGDAAGSPTSDSPSTMLRYSKREGRSDSCLCADPNLECYADHYAGSCSCACDDGSDCVLLARLEMADSDSGWTVDHRVRRFIRPVLMRDPQIEIEEQGRQFGKAKAQTFAALEDAEAALRAAHMQAGTAHEAAEAAAEEARARVKVLEARRIALQDAENQQAAAMNVTKTAKTGATRARKAAEKAADPNKASAEEAANKAAEQANSAEAALDIAVRRKEDAEAQLRAATADEMAARYIASKMDTDRLAAYRAVDTASEKLDALKKELSRLEASNAPRYQ